MSVTLQAKALSRIALAAVLALSALGARADAQSRLQSEPSPYLRLHAHDPVDWYPWGPEAFARARKENKPVFLSIGYSTCHWCHVMQRESFSDPSVAKLLNENFVCVLVDREQRPEIDRIYQTFVQASTGEGGWPLTAWLTPELKPFFGGTYFGPEGRPGQPSFKDVIGRIAETWTKQREQVLQSSEQMFAALSADARASAPLGALPVDSLRSRALSQISDSFDAANGGFEQAPKFPQTSVIGLLLDLHETSSDPKERDLSLRMAMETLRAMERGGIHDSVGGGFHRYSVDAQWRVPHFEKMLGDQAQIVSNLAAAWQVDGDESLRDSARGTIAYVLRDLTSPSGGFYTAEDADSARAPGSVGGSEGSYYLWTKPELDSVLGHDESTAFSYAFGATDEGNAGGDFGAENVLYRAHSDAECAEHFGSDKATVASRLRHDLNLLKSARDLRPRPLRDEKILTGANGLMISALALASQSFADPDDTRAAERAAAFIRESMFDAASGRLAHSFSSGQRDTRAFSDDYAFLIQGLIDLYETNLDVSELKWAVALQEKQIELFGDPVAGGFYANTADDPSVLLRLKEDNDGAEPSSNSVSIRNLLRLSAMVGRKDWRTLAESTAKAFAGTLEHSPTSLPAMLCAVGWLQGSPQQVLILGDPQSVSTRALESEVWKRYLPRRVLIRIDPSSRPYFSGILPLVADLPAGATGEATAYVCRNFVCQLPTQDPVELGRVLRKDAPSKR